MYIASSMSGMKYTIAHHRISRRSENNADTVMMHTPNHRTMTVEHLDGVFLLSIQPILHLHTFNTITHLLHGPNLTIRPFVITIGLPIVIMQVRTLLSKCPTLLVDQIVLALFDSGCVVEHEINSQWGSQRRFGRGRYPSLHILPHKQCA